MNDYQIDHAAIARGVPYPNNYNNELLTFARGKGVYLYDTAGRRYLDLGSGIAVNALGYGRRDLARTAARQMRRLIHVSNLFANEPALRVAERLLRTASGVMREPPVAVHYGNSGSEANEAALKYARLHALRSRGAGHHKFLCFENGFHGRTIGALAVTPNPKYRDPFLPLLPDITVCPYNDGNALERTMSSEYAAVIVEVVQGEGGLQVMTPQFAATLSRLCAQHDVLLIADEVQTGLGRTGTLYASQQRELKPDIITLSKPLAGGLPLSATLIPDRVNRLLNLGEHGSTFGGGPVTTAVAEQVLATIEAPRFQAQVQQRARELDTLLDSLRSARHSVTGVHGLGLLRGVELAVDAARAATVLPTVLERMRAAGVLILRSGANVVRIAPPLTITADELERGITALDRELRQLESENWFETGGTK